MPTTPESPAARFARKQNEALDEIDRQLGHLADLGFVDEIWRIRAKIEKEFPID